MTRLSYRAPPALPHAPAVYTPGFFNQLLGILRLYFNTIFDTFKQLGGETGGSLLLTPHGQFSNPNTVSFLAADTATLIPLGATDYARAMTFASGDGVHVECAGRYNYQYSLQLENTDAQIHEVTLWLRHNGADIPATGSKFSVVGKHSGINGYVLAVCNFFVELDAGDYVELWGSVSNTAINVEAYPAQTVPYAAPAIPSIVVTLSFVSSI